MNDIIIILPDKDRQFLDILAKMFVENIIFDNNTPTTNNEVRHSI